MIAKKLCCLLFITYISIANAGICKLCYQYRAATFMQCVYDKSLWSLYPFYCRKNLAQSRLLKNIYPRLDSDLKKHHVDYKKIHKPPFQDACELCLNQYAILLYQQCMQKRRHTQCYDYHFNMSELVQIIDFYPYAPIGNPI